MRLNLQVGDVIEIEEPALITIQGQDFKMRRFPAGRFEVIEADERGLVFEEKASHPQAAAVD